jgi:hypothetical protein
MFTALKSDDGRGMSFLGGNSHNPTPVKKGGNRKVSALFCKADREQIYVCSVLDTHMGYASG